MEAIKLWLTLSWGVIILLLCWCKWLTDKVQQLQQGIAQDEHEHDNGSQ